MFSDQLEDYVSAVASMYRDNPFHNFEHASHVVMSVVKLCRVLSLLTLEKKRCRYGVDTS
jgi:hypothetical protein